MESSNKTAPQTSSSSILGISPELLLSLATGPLLLGLIGSKVLSEAIRDLGLLSEEVFRGDRLPILNFPASTSSHPGDDTAV